MDSAKKGKPKGKGKAKAEAAVVMEGSGEVDEAALEDDDEIRWADYDVLVKTWFSFEQVPKREWPC